jgi:hypothetical protein
VRTTFPGKYSSEIRNLTFDFTSLLGIGETISTQVVTCAVFSGTDASPSSLINGSATKSGAVVTQSVTGGVVGVAYNLTCTITTSASQTLQMQGLLVVLPSAI